MNSIPAQYLIFFIMALFALAFAVFSLYDRKARRQTDRSREHRDEIREQHRTNVPSLQKQLQEAEHRQDRFFHEAVSSDRITGNASVDLILQRLDRLCQEKSVSFTCHIGRIPDLPISDQQLASLFGNVLSNAIEAAEKVGGDVLLECRTMKGQWVLTVENSKPADEAPLENGMHTTKEHGEHGLGTSIIDSIVAKADGYVKRKDNGERFRLFIAIPIEVNP